MKIVKKFICAVAILAITINATQITEAAGAGLLSSVGHIMNTDDMQQVTMDYSKVKETNILDYSNCTSDAYDDFHYTSTACALTPNETKYIYYKDALDFGDRKIDVKLEITRTTGPIRDDYRINSNLKTEDINHIVLLANNKVRFYGMGEYNGVGTVVDNRNTNRTIVNVVTSFYYNGQPYEVSGFLGIDDPDGSNYSFVDADKREIYYANAPLDDDKIGVAENKMLDEVYVVNSNGMYRNDTDLPILNEPFWKNAKIAIELKNENSFTVSYEMSTDYIVIPSMYSIYYNISYIMHDEDGPKANNPNENWTRYLGGESGTLQDPTRTGYTFKGWTRQDVTDPDDSRNESIVERDTGDKVFEAQWEKTEYQLTYNKNHQNAEGTMTPDTAVLGSNKTKDNQFTNKGYDFLGWSLLEGENTVTVTNGGNVTVEASDVQGKEPGAIVKTLYAQWSPKKYQILYDPNADDVKNPDAMETQTFDVVTNPNKWNSTDPWVYEREGYSLNGYKIENEGETFKNLQDFKDYLLDDEDQKVTLYAQWEPWKYYIDYDPNGGTGNMPMQTFAYQDETMMSKRNEFTRDGYKFTGFLYYYKGNTKLITDPAEFKQLLLELGPESKITLIAQWEKIPTKVVAIPVTGVE